MVSSKVLLICISFQLFAFGSTLKPGQCEVCVKYISNFIESLSDEDKKDPKIIEGKFKETCKTSKGRENKLCYYIGGLVESATGILGELSKPLSWGMDAAAICEKIKKKDSEICTLRYKMAQKDLKNVDLKKLKVRDLKDILNEWDEVCDDCLEKGDYVRRIQELMPKYVKEEL